MRLEELAEDFPAAELGADAAEAVLQMAAAHRVGIVVLDGAGAPLAVLTGARILAAVIPRYLRDDPGLARVVDQNAADEIFERLAGKTVAVTRDGRFVGAVTISRLLRFAAERAEER